MIANSRNGPVSANYDRKKNYEISQEKLYNFLWSQNEEMGHSLQITIARKTRPFLKKTLYNFSWSQIPEMGQFLQITIARKTIQFLVIAKWRNGSLSANYDRKKNFAISQKKTVQFLLITKCRNAPLSANYDRKRNFTISQEKLYDFSWSRNEETGHFLQITIARKTRLFLKKNHTISRDRNCRNEPLSANYDRKENQTISQKKPYNFSWSQIAEYGHFL